MWCPCAVQVYPYLISFFLYYSVNGYSIQYRSSWLIFKYFSLARLGILEQEIKFYLCILRLRPYSNTPQHSGQFFLCRDPAIAVSLQSARQLSENAISSYLFPIRSSEDRKYVVVELSIAPILRFQKASFGFVSLDI